MRTKFFWQYGNITVALIFLLGLIPALSVWADETDLFQRGNALLEQEKYSEALTAYETFVGQNPNHRLAGAAKWTMGNIHMTVHEDLEKAAELFQSVIEEHANTEWELFAYDRLGRCYEAQEKWTQAAEAYQPVIRKLAASTQVAVTTAWGGGLKRRLLTSYQNMGDSQSIIGLYQEVLAENPASPSAPEDQFQLAQAYLDNDNLQEAAENFAQVVERYPASPYAQQVQGEQADFLASQLGYDWELFSTFQAAQELRRAGQYDEALAQFDEVIDAVAKTSMAHAAIFQKHLVEYQKSGDASALRDEIASGRNEYPLGFGGVPVDQLSDVLRGICQAQQALESNPEDASAYQQMGLGYYQTQAYQCGIDAYQKAIAIAPDATLAHNMLGYCSMGAGKFEEAVSAFQRLAEVAPEDPNSYDSLAEGYYQLGDTTKAIQYYQQALAVDSTFSNSYYMLGTIYQERGRRDDAIAHLERYIQLDPGGFQAPNAQRQLDQLQPSSDVQEP